jgi:hypothetical protein
MKNEHILQIISQISSFIGSQDTHGQADQRPQMDCLPGMVALFGQVVDLGMTVMARCNAVICAGGQDLVGLEFTIGPPLFRIARLQKAAPAAAAVVVGAVGGHIDKILFAHDGLDHIAQVFGNRIAEGFPYQLTGILNGKSDFQILVPIGIDFEFTFTEPLSIILNDAFNLEVVVDLEFIQSEPDCK